MGFKVTYATLSADNEEMLQRFAAGVETCRSWLGKDYPFYVDGEARVSDDTMEERRSRPGPRGRGKSAYKSWSAPQSSSRNASTSSPH